MNEYDIIKIYEQMERELIRSMTRNLERHKKEEAKVGFKFSQWQADKLRSLREYRHENRTIINTYTKGLDKSVTRLLNENYKDGKLGAFEEYKQAVKDGYENEVEIQPKFFETNSRKANAMIKVINNDLKKANNAALRRSNDIYREVIHKASTFVSNGVYTEKKAVDMAIKEFRAKGINCIVYKNGAKHTISDYTSMAIRTASQRTQLMAEGEFRKEIGETLVKMSKHGTSCEVCQQFEGKVYIDDVYSGGTKEDGNYPLLSEAMKQGMFHPNCRHGLNTYYEGITDAEPQKDEGMKDAADTNVGTLKEPVFDNFEDYKKYVDKLQPEVDESERDLETIKYWEEQIKKGNHRPIMVRENDIYSIVDGNHTLVAYRNLNIIPPNIYKVDRKEMFNAVANGEHELDWLNRLIKENKVQKLYNETIKNEVTVKEFIPATTKQEVANRMKDALGAVRIELGRMDVELANEYLEGVETFMNEYPQLKNYVWFVDTNAGKVTDWGIFSSGDTYFTSRKETLLNYFGTIHLKSPKDLQRLRRSYEYSAETLYQYIGCSPKTTAIHELTHALEYLMHRKKDKLPLRKVDYQKGNLLYTFGDISSEIIKQARMEVFGATTGDKVRDGVKFLGRYAMANSQEELAQAISYEMGVKTNPYSAKIKEIFDKKVKELLK